MSSESPLPRRRRLDPTPVAGFRCLIPGLAQGTSGQPGRGGAFFGCFASSLATGLMAWGTWIGGLALLLAFGVHVASTVDVLRSAAFPGIGRRASWCFAVFGLGLGCYTPAFAVAATFAWPAAGSGGRYLIDRSAFHDRAPTAGEWVWVRRPEGRGEMLAWVLASPGQAVASEGGRLRVSGSPPEGLSSAKGWDVEALAFDVPEGFLLVTPEAGGVQAPRAAGRLELVASAEVLGRPWARLAPAWLRGPLPGRGSNWSDWGVEAWPERVAVGTIGGRR